jgi:uncharacterized protein YdeI (YjbR/CyaY-like superfamily)
MSEAPRDSFQPKDRADWRNWLAENHTRPDGVWLVYYKQSSGKRNVNYEEVVLEALCFGWIDSKGNKLDDERTLLWMAPRKKGSGWSGTNKRRVEHLLADGLMTPAGMEKIEAAKQDGSWQALDAVEKLEIPPDLEQALAANPAAQQNFNAFPPSARGAILQWISMAKRPETRAKRIEETVSSAEQNIRANQWRP